MSKYKKHTMKKKDIIRLLVGYLTPEQYIEFLKYANELWYDIGEIDGAINEIVTEELDDDITLS